MSVILVKNGWNIWGEILHFTENTTYIVRHLMLIVVRWKAKKTCLFYQFSFRMEKYLYLSTLTLFCNKRKDPCRKEQKKKNTKILIRGTALSRYKIGLTPFQHISIIIKLHMVTVHHRHWQYSNMKQSL